MCEKFKHHDHNHDLSCFCCPPRPKHSQKKTLTFSNCVPVSDTSNTANNVVFSGDADIDAVLAASFENTGTIGFNVNVIFFSGPSQTFSLQPGDSVTILKDNVREIALTGFSPTVRYTGIFNYQLTYTFEV